MKKRPSGGQKPRSGEKSDHVEAAKNAMMKRGKKGGDDMLSYKVVIGVFVVVCVASVLYVFLNPKKSMKDIPVVDEEAMLLHNSESSFFKVQENEMFKNWTLANARSLFAGTYLSDTSNLNLCENIMKEEVELPEEFDARSDESFYNCASPVTRQGNCSSAYASAILSTIEDRICINSRGTKRVELSLQDALACDELNQKCDGGTSYRTLRYGQNHGFVDKSCFEEQEGRALTCPKEKNACRKSKHAYKVNNFCVVQGSEQIKKEIKLRGPVTSYLVPTNDFLVYSEGIYHRTQAAFKFQGTHLVKIVGWGTRAEAGAEYWIVQNSFGEDWGQEGYAQVAMGQGETGLETAFAIYVQPYTAAEQAEIQRQTAQAQARAEADAVVDPDAEETPVEEEEPAAQEGEKKKQDL